MPVPLLDTKEFRFALQAVLCALQSSMYDPLGILLAPCSSEPLIGLV